MNEVDKILAIIVLYETCLDNSETFKTLTSSLKENNQKLHLLVYDNSLKSQNIKEYPQWKISYQHNADNPGVGKAYNEGNKLSISMNKKWMLLLDQDTYFPLNSINIINNCLDGADGVKLFAPILKKDKLFISPSIYKFNRGFAPRNILPGKTILKGWSPINSGLIVDSELFYEVAGYNEKIKLDFSDFYFIKKLSKKITHFYIMDLICKHNLSTISFEHKLNNGVIYRYQNYCEGAKNSVNSFGDYVILSLVTLLRGIKLTVKYRTDKFLLIFFRFFVKGSNYNNDK